MDGADRTSGSMVSNRASRCRRLMCWESASHRMNAYCACLYTRTLGTIRAAGRKGVSLHRASRHVGTDLSFTATSCCLRYSCHILNLVGQTVMFGKDKDAYDNDPKHEKDEEKFMAEW
jgi:hypothetical protein